MKNFGLKKALLILFCLMLYLNIGYHLGMYSYENVFYTTPETGLAKFLAGGWESFSRPDTTSEIPLVTTLVMHSVFWPLMMIMVLITWFAFGIGIVLEWLVSFLSFLIWLIFQGGFGELLAGEHATIILLLGAVVALFTTVSIFEMEYKRVANFFLALTGILIVLLFVSLIF